ncbi:SAP domain-containing protein [Weissella minor]|uniref:SAP domain-containing protein n=1 Tax=Weissella minor TaxID=1620 RepID=A0A0R2JI89_9LACO|nr:SAP domain-containing protein [Weissella minor]KRN77003.1 hypothetical protein IV67_GL000516 [Weissella minor]
MPEHQFNPNMSITSFRSLYWYKTELINICKTYQLPTYGTKNELTTYIVRFLQGESVDCIKPVRQRRISGIQNPENITPSTPILQSGLSLNTITRQFFCTYYQVEKFSFTKAMGIKMRQIESTHDTDATVQDLINTYDHPVKNLTDNAEETTYEWNHFVHDFNQDARSKQFDKPLKVAAVLWHHVRDSTHSKIYQSQLLDDYHDELMPFLKNSQI